ncbi:MAG: marine proteobacterial sortase target protein [Pirellulaceae bacterium]
METGEAKAGTLLVRTSDQSPMRPIPMVGTEVEIKVTGMIARSVVTQHFKNPTGEWLEGIYVFPLPETAAVDTLSMKIGERVIVGEIKERAEAKKIYTKAKAEGKKASLLEQERPNLFSTSVANIGPGEVIAITIEYQEVMRYDRGGFSLRFPTVVAPRYIPGTRNISGFSGTGWANDTDEVGDASRITPPVLNSSQGSDEPFYSPTVRIRAQINAGFPVKVTSRSHEIRVTNSKDTSVITLKDELVPADRDFLLEWRPQVGSAPDAALFSDTVDGQTYALIMVMPPDATVGELKPLPKEVIYVIDTSGSMNGESIHQAKAALELALTRLSPDDYFQIINFHSQTHKLFESPLPATPQNIQTAVSSVRNLVAGGGTEMLPALSAALGNRTHSNRVRQVIFITDGSVGNELTLLGYIRNYIGQSRLFTIGIGSAPNGFFMRKVAEMGRGTFTYIGKTSEVKLKMNELFRKLESPVLTKIKVDWKSRGVEYYPEPIPDLYAGEPILIAAKLSKLGGNVEISGWRGKKPWAVDFKLEGGRSHSGVDRLYARKKIEKLTSSRLGGASKESVRKKIVRLGLAHHLVTKHTSLVAVEQVASRPKDQQLKTSPAPVNLPHGWRYDSVFGTAEERTLAISQTYKKESERKLAEKYREAKRLHEKIRVSEAEKSRGPQTLKSSSYVLRMEVPRAESENSNSQLAADATTMKKVNATSQPLAVAKLQENAGIIPKTATPAALFLMLGLALLTLAGYSWVRRAES